jgi:4'-phosphopantetheinyl transferase EntD
VQAYWATSKYSSFSTDNLTHNNSLKMAIVFSKNISENCIVTLWKIEENAHFFLRYLNLSETELPILSNATHPQKQLEWLASRTCIKYTVEQLEHSYQGIEKDEHNNPSLTDIQGFVSLSHTSEYAVAIVSLSEEVGIDIEKVSHKLSRVAHKFLSSVEYLEANQNLLKLCIYWCAKESLYKWYGKKNLSFKENIFIEPFGTEPNLIKGEIFIDGIQKTEHELLVFYVDDYIITATI